MYPLGYHKSRNGAGNNKNVLLNSNNIKYLALLIKKNAKDSLH